MSREIPATDAAVLDASGKSVAGATRDLDVLQLDPVASDRVPRISIDHAV